MVGWPAQNRGPNLRRRLGEAVSFLPRNARSRFGPKKTMRPRCARCPSARPPNSGPDAPSRSWCIDRRRQRRRAWANLCTHARAPGSENAEAADADAAEKGNPKNSRTSSGVHPVLELLRVGTPSGLREREKGQTGADAVFGFGSMRIFFRRSLLTLPPAAASPVWPPRWPASTRAAWWWAAAARRGRTATRGEASER